MPNFNEPQMDERYHLEVAKEINSGTLPAEPYFRAPLYLYFFARLYQITGGSLYGVRLVQIILGSLLPVLVFFLTLRVFNQKLALLSAFIAVIYPTFLYYDNSLLITSLMVLLTTLLCWQLYRTQEKPSLLNLIISGVLLGLAGLARPNILLFGPALFIWIWLALRPKLGIKKAVFGYVLIGVATVVTILPVTIRNYVAGHDFVLIAWQGGLNFFLGNNQDASGWSATVSFIDPGWKGGYEESIAIPERALGRTLKRSEISNYWYGRAMEDIREYPGHFVMLMLKKLWFFLNGEEIPNNQNLYLARDFVPILRPLMFHKVLFFPYGLLAPLAVIGIVMSIRDWRKYLLIYLLLGSYIITLLLFFVCARYRQPLIPLLIPFALLGVSKGISYLRSGNWKRIALFAAVFILLLVGLNQTVAGTEQGGLAYQDEYSLGIMYYDKGDLVNAEEHLRKSIELNPDFAKPYINLGLIARRQGDYQQAMRYYQRAVDIDSTEWLGYTNAAAILKRAGDMSKAIALLERARAVAPQSDIVHINLAQDYFEVGRIDDARREIAEAVRINPNDPRIKQIYNQIMAAPQGGQ